MKIIRRQAPPDVRPEALKWDVRQRLAMLEATLLWEERVTTQALTRLFGISRGQASKDFSLYQQLAPHNVAYDLNLKGYVALDTFSPLFIRGTAEEFLQLVEAGALLGQSVALPITPYPVGVELVRMPARKLDLRLLRLMHRAIRERQQLAGRYQSLTRASRELLIEPHTLVFSGFRWHVRAYSYEHAEFRDFVLARFQSEPSLTGEPATHSIEEDRDWQTWETLRIVPNPALTPAQQAAVAEDFGMRRGVLELKVRRAIGFYYRRLLDLDERGDSAPPGRSHQLVLANKS